MAAVKQLLDQWGCQYQFLSMVPFDSTNEQNELGYNPGDAVGVDLDVRHLYQPILNLIKPSVYQIVFDQKWFSGNGIPDAYDGRRRDFHPTPTEHLQYLDHVAPGLITQASTRQWMQDWDFRVRNNTATWTQPNRPVRL
jgi:hypothetical protein